MVVNFDTNDGTRRGHRGLRRTYTGTVTFVAAGCVAPPVAPVVGVTITDDAIYEPGGNETFTLDLGT